MHTAVVDIAIQGDLAKASASHFHTVVPFHDLLTIWFSYGQNLWSSAFRILVYSIRFPCLCIHRLSLFGRETRPFLFSKNYLFGGDNRQLHHSILRKQRKQMRCVRDSNPWPPAWLPMKESNFLNCHLTTSPPEDITESNSNQPDMGVMIFEMVYSIIQAGILTSWTNTPFI